ncbi:TetR/AcrR family transcriptional regulator [Brucella pseudogrignonensis]
MVGKRERNKQQKYFDFISVAARLFADKGVEKTTMLEIAEKAASGAKTLNRYFPTKNDLVIAIMKEDDRLSLKRLEIKAKKLPACPIDRIVELFSAYADYADIISNVSVWREYEAIRVSEYKKSPASAESTNLRADAVSAVKAILEQCVDDKLIVSGVSIDSLTNVIHAVALLTYHKVLRGNYESEEEAVRSLRSNIAFIVTPYLLKVMPVI